MNSISKLKLVSSKRVRVLSPTVVRRNKLSSKISEQLELVTAQIEGRSYSPLKRKTYVNAETGERRSVETLKRVREWFWKTDAGKYNLSVKYGSKTIELAKGKNAIEVANRDELVQVLSVVRQAVVDGELDDAITTACEKLRSGFGR